MKLLGLRGKYKKAFRTTTQSNHHLPVSPIIVNRYFHTNAPNQCWVSDITYLKVGNRWLYLCIIVDLYSRAVVGWSLRPHMRAEWVIEAYKKTVYRRRPPQGILFHSDHGVQFASSRFKEKLKKQQAIQSMTRKGNCWVNPIAESFFSTLKKKLGDRFCSEWKTNKELFLYIEGFYNCKRLHSAIDDSAPLNFENQWRLAA